MASYVAAAGAVFFFAHAAVATMALFGQRTGDNAGWLYTTCWGLGFAFAYLALI